MTMNECEEWLKECFLVFPDIQRKKIHIDYKEISSKKLGYVSAKIERKLDFNAEALLLGEEAPITEKKIKPKEFKIFINRQMHKIGNIALRKQIVQNVILHELLHIENEDLFTISKVYSRRKKKKIHIHEFEEEVFERYNKLRSLKGIAQIKQKEHLDLAIQKILETINWFEKK